MCSFLVTPGKQSEAAEGGCRLEFGFRPRLKAERCFITSATSHDNPLLCDLKTLIYLTRLPLSKVSYTDYIYILSIYTTLYLLKEIQAMNTTVFMGKAVVTFFGYRWEFFNTMTYF